MQLIFQPKKWVRSGQLNQKGGWPEFYILHFIIYLPRFDKILKEGIKTTNKTLKKLWPYGIVGDYARNIDVGESMGVRF